MTSSFQERTAAGLARLHGHTEDDATYNRPSTAQTLAISATPGRSDFDELTPHGLAVRSQSQDFLIRNYTALMTTFTAPRSGDQIVHGGRTYVVTPIGDEPVYTFSGHNRQVLRIHTKLSAI